MKLRKGARNIVVAGVHYRWRATGNDGFIGLTIWPATLPGPAIVANFDYLGIITARIVRRVVLMSVAKQRYDPRLAGKEVSFTHAHLLVDVSDIEPVVRKERFPWGSL